MITTQIQLGANGFLDLEDNLATPFNYSINEIRDVASKTSSYSKNIRVIGTANNRQLFGQLFNVNIADSSFDINVKTPCTVLRNGVPIFEGYLQLNSVEKREESDSVYFNITIIDAVGDFYTALADFELTDITFDFSLYDHIYDINSIVATTGNTAYNSVYKYHLYSNGKQEYNLQDFKPSIWAKRYFDSIFADAGYTYQWDSISECGFDKLIVPTNVELPKKSDAEIARSSLRAGWSIPQTGITLSNGNFRRVIPNDDSTGPVLFDPSDMYNPAFFSGLITSNMDGALEIKTGYNYKIYFTNPNAETAYLFGGFEDDGSGNYLEQDSSLTVKIYNSYVPNNELTTYSNSNWDWFTYEASQTPTTTSRIQIPPNGELVLGQGTSPSFDMIKSVIIGETIAQVLYERMELNGFWAKFIGSIRVPLTPNSNNYPQLKIDIGLNPPDYGNNYLTVTPVGLISQGDTVFLQKFIPKQVKQREFISSIIKMFNLYLTPDKDNPKKIIIKTRDEFYDEGPTLDWTQKIDISTDVKIDFLPDLQNASILWTNKNDTNDIVAKTYFESQNQIYGQYRYTFNNEWVTGEKKIETIFDTAPLVPDGRNNIVTTGGFKGLRILYDGGLKPGTWKYRISPYYPKVYRNFSLYPYAGHFDDPLAPELDFNFGLINDIAYNTWDYLTNNNLYNRFWSRTTEQIRTGKLYTAKIFLTEEDILKLDLSSKIWIRDSYYYINKVKDYDPNNPGPTSVEFLSVEQYNFSPQKKYITKPGTSYNWTYADGIKPFQQVQDNSGIGVVGTIGTGVGNNFNTNVKDTLVAGDGNNIAGSNIVIAGDNNNVSGTKSMVFGNNNTVTADNAFLFGVNNVRADQAGVNLIGGATLNYVNYIDAGRNQVINKYPPTKIINFIDAGRDVVRAIGSYSIETNIVAGRDQII